MKKLTLAALAVFGTLSAMHAVADDAPPPPYTLTSNIGVVSDYTFRGISQTARKPAFQGGFDFAHAATGLYVGTWGSNVSGAEYNNGASLEWDIYGGWKKSVGNWTFDAGLYEYYYPGSKVGTSDVSYNTLEAYGDVTWRWFMLKYNSTTGDYFGAPKSTGSGYLDLTANFAPTDAIGIVAHVGHQTVKGFSDASYTDEKLGVTYTIGTYTWGLTYINTNGKNSVYKIDTSTTGGSGPIENIARATGVLSVIRTF